MNIWVPYHSKFIRGFCPDTYMRCFCSGINFWGPYLPKFIPEYWTANFLFFSIRYLFGFHCPPPFLTLEIVSCVGLYAHLEASEGTGRQFREVAHDIWPSHGVPSFSGHSKVARNFREPCLLVILPMRAIQ